MKIKKVISLLRTAVMLLAVPAGNVYAGAEDQSVVVTMPTTSEPESGFDPAYGWGAGEHVHEPLTRVPWFVPPRTLELKMILPQSIPAVTMVLPGQ